MNEQTFLPEHFINRELSWLEFNARVLEEAEDATNPLLERVKFLSIFSSNLDEFFMVRVAGLREQAFGDGAPQDYTPDGLRPITQLQRIAKRTQELVAAQYRCWNESVVPQLAAGRHPAVAHDELSDEQRETLDRFFRERAFPILTPMAVDPAIPARTITTAACTWRRCSSGDAAWGRSSCSPSCRCRRCLPRLVPVGQRRRAAVHPAGRRRCGAAAGAVRRLRRAHVDDVPHHARQRHRAVGARVGRHAAADRRPPQGPAARRSRAAGSGGRRRRRAGCG